MITIKIFHSRWLREIIFLLATLSACSPLLFLSIIPSLDGPQHLYTTNVIAQLWEGNRFLSNYFTLNDIIVGNATGHYLLSVYQLVFSPNFAEKAFYITYIFFLAYSFRYLVLAFNDKITFHSVLIVPFSITSLFLLGYYNFSISFGFFFLFLGYWFRVKDMLKPKNGLVLALLFLLVYISHAFTYLLLLYGLALLEVLRFIYYVSGKEGVALSLKEFFKKTIYLLVALIPSFVLWVIYIKRITSLAGTAAAENIGIGKLLEFFFHIRSSIGFHYELESKVNYLLLGIIFLILLIWIIVRFFKKEKKQTVNFDHYSGIILFGLYFILYLFFPNQMTSGNITNRISTVMFFMLIFWISILRVPASFSFVVSLIVIGLSLQQRRVQYEFQYALDNKAKEIFALEEGIQENSTLITLNYSENWAELHYGCYLGLEKGVANLKNPQCDGQFPLVWNYDSIPWNFIWTHEENTIFKSNAPINYKSNIRPVDYILFWRWDLFEKSDDYSLVMEYVTPFYKEVSTSPFGMAKLYRFHSYDKYYSYIKQIKKDNKWHKEIQSKAIKRGLSVDNMISIDALYMIYNNKNP